MLLNVFNKMMEIIKLMAKAGEYEALAYQVATKQRVPKTTHSN
jgi:hypothetical protein